VSYPSGGAAPSGVCQPPNLMAENITDVKKHTHELRFTTPGEERVRATFGVFYDDLKLEDRGNFIYFGSQFVRGFNEGDIGFPRNAPFPDQTAIDPSFRQPGVIFFNDITRSEDQIAVFGEVSADVIENTLTATFGVRWYDIDTDLVGGANSSFGNLFAQEDVNQFGTNLDIALADFRPAEESGVIFRGNLSWTPNDDMLFYFTWSEGFRPGGLNRGCGNGNPEFGFVPCAFETDEVTNWEVGWKLSLFDNTLRFNGNAFFVDWSDMQSSVFNPQIFFLTFNDNTSDSEVKGVEGDFVWSATRQLQISGAFSWLDAEITSVPASAISVAGPGNDLALAPSFQGTVRGRYMWFMGDYDMHVQTSVQYSDSSFSSIVVNPNNRFKQDDYAIWNLSFGVARDSWRAEIYADNLSDTRADLFTNTQDADLRIVTNRPRTVGVRVAYDY